MINNLHVGFSKAIDPPPGGCLFIDDEVREIPRARVFDPLKDCFNPLAGIGYKKACEVADVLYKIAPQGENTPTVRNGKAKEFAERSLSDMSDLRSFAEMTQSIYLGLNSFTHELRLRLQHKARRRAAADQLESDN